VVLEKWVVKEHVVGIQLVVVREVLVKLVVLVVEE
jgi:hypothetical protein